MMVMIGELVAEVVVGRGIALGLGREQAASMLVQRECFRVTAAHCAAPALLLSWLRETDRPAEARSWGLPSRLGVSSVACGARVGNGPVCQQESIDRTEIHLLKTHGTIALPACNTICARHIVTSNRIQKAVSATDAKLS